MTLEEVRKRTLPKILQKEHHLANTLNLTQGDPFQTNDLKTCRIIMCVVLSH